MTKRTWPGCVQAAKRRVPAALRVALPCAVPSAGEAFPNAFFISFCCFGIVYLLDSWQYLRSLIEVRLHLHCSTSAVYSQPLATLFSPGRSLQAKLQGETFELMSHVEECLQKLQR